MFEVTSIIISEMTCIYKRIMPIKLINREKGTKNGCKIPNWQTTGS